ncbi:hypothetical protein BKA69DRAFT_366578 [Paraphysoderma sedebokerense]|nr:hypothetical protein BKA69DRAFT_366578 [Paraphysoderma sedebokerense]
MISETASRYGGVTPRSYRQAIRQQRQAIYQAQQKLMEENPEAGSGMVLHKDSKWKATWSSFKENNPVMQRMFSVGKAVTESDNPVVNFGRWLVEGIQDRFGSIFEETETAQATAQIQMVDPTFNVEDFLKEAREFIIPEVMEAYLLSDRDTLKEFCGEGAYNVLTAGIKTQEQENLRSDSKLVDLRNVELVTAKVLDNSVPVLILSFSTQEIFLFRDRISGEVKFGKPDHITSNTYVAVMTIDEGGAMAHPVTKGWKVLELAKHSSRTLAL